MTRSGGCQTCKLRRIKCDEGKPVCDRCVKSRRICIVAPTTKQVGFSIHNENQYASGNVKRPRGPRSALTEKQPTLDLETRALAYFMQFHVQTGLDAPVAMGGLSEGIIAWTASGRRDSLVDLALSAMALGVYANTHHEEAEVATTQASNNYYQLLHTAQKRIAKVDTPAFNENDIDACLLTIFLMGRYEGVMHRPKDGSQRQTIERVPVWSHHEGAMAILKVWYDRLSHYQSEIVRQTRRGQIRSAVLRTRQLPDWILDGTRFGEQGLDLEYDRIMVRTMLLRESLAVHRQLGNIQVPDLEKLVNEAQHVNAALEDWIDKIARDCPRYEHTVSMKESLPNEQFYSKRVFSFDKPGHAGVWCSYLSAKMLITSTHFRVFELKGPDLSTYRANKWQRIDCLGWLKNTADELAASIPFRLGRLTSTEPGGNIDEGPVELIKDDHIKPYITGLLVWPLTIASSIAEIDEDQRQWFRSELAKMGEILGDSMLAGANTDLWTITI